MNSSLSPASPLYSSPASDLDGFASLAELATDMRSCWNHAADEVWRQLDPELWGLTHNPWVILQTMSRDRLERALKDPAFRAAVEEQVATRRRYMERETWFAREHPQSPLACVAYFSMEFMLSQTLPIYSGGLGNVAGDQLKAASDLGVPVIGISLLYQQGYFRQVIDKNGAQQTSFPYNDPDELPITPVRQPDGQWLRLEVKLPGYSLWLRAWQAQVGRARLFLLDTNDAANFPLHRGITSELYGGGPELRINQEMVLGMGGWRLLRALGIEATVCHLNEGHAAFVVLERARSFMEQTGQPFEVALAATRAANIFTTHTPVAAGFDWFSPALVEQYLGWYATERLHIPLQQLLALGRRNADDASEYFNMAYLAVRGCAAVNAVSRLHGAVSRQIFAPLFPRWPVEEVPIGHVTNGVHTPSWDSPEADKLWAEVCGPKRWVGATEHLQENIQTVSDQRLWQFRTASRRSLVQYVREIYPRQLAVSGASAQEIEHAANVLDPNALTLGFARRFAPYKRPTLLLHDQDRLARLLSDTQRPVQLLIAGKAHPADPAGQWMVHQWIEFMRRPDVKARAVFLADYDMMLAERLVQGVDVWINTPRRPWEASGTSGMKVLVNGGLNLSELDGWWAEAYRPEVGWALGDGREHGDDPQWDTAEALALYDLLERQVVPAFYSRGNDGIPAGWVSRMRQSMAQLTPQFSANRVVRQYTEQYYLPAASAYRSRAADKGLKSRLIVERRKSLENKWKSARFGELKVTTVEGEHVLEVQVFLGELDPDTIRIELFANGQGTQGPIRQEMHRQHPQVGAVSGFLYTVRIPATRPVSDFTPRMIPRIDDIAVPLETGLILWQR